MLNNFEINMVTKLNMQKCLFVFLSGVVFKIYTRYQSITVYQQHTRLFVVHYFQTHIFIVQHLQEHIHLRTTQEPLISNIPDLLSQ